MLKFFLLFLFTPAFMLLAEALPAPTTIPKTAPPQGTTQPQPPEEEQDLADRQDLYEYNLYDRSENRQDRQRQQYYYTQPEDSRNAPPQYNRSKSAHRADRNLYFNPNDE